MKFAGNEEKKDFLKSRVFQVTNNPHDWDARANAPATLGLSEYEGNISRWLALVTGISALK